MIELQNVVKKYKSKKGHTTTALNNISVKFDNKGMTFILGKSGSGKSTMLNVIGGLDKYDSGDIIILGKSTKNFKKADFDSYRNTYVGFVFQEFNILEDYNVYENIVLALQLQQKNIDEDKIDKLLVKLELKDLKRRKVNELSGGQKQRVAIARALIKEPKIILADEPTGNLDSKTGKQVMDLLKEISLEKLVIIVSHDNESASIYGDRIIEISDGHIIRDTKENVTINNLDNYKIIKSKLPIKESFKLGLGSLRHKKIKLTFAIILCMLSLLFLSLTDTLSSFNINLAHSKLLKDRGEQFVQIEKYNWYEDDYVNRNNLKLDEDDIKNIQSRIHEKSDLIYRITKQYGYSDIYEAFHIISEYTGYSYTYGNLTLEIVETDDFHYIDNAKLIGRKPVANDEIVISNMIADLMIKNGVIPYAEEETYYPKDYQDILNSGKTFYLGNDEQVKIVGIIVYDLGKYKKVIEKENSYINWTNEEQKLFTEYSANLNNIYNKVFVKKGFMDNINISKDLPLNSDYHYELTSSDVHLREEGLYISPSIISQNILYFNGTDWIKTDHLNKNEVVLNVKQLEEFDLSNYRNQLTTYINQNLHKTQLEAEKEFFANYVKNYDIYDKKVSLTAQAAYTNEYDMKQNDLVVVGITGMLTTGEEYYYLSSELMEKYVMKPVTTFGVLVYENSQKGFKKLIDEFPYTETISLKSTYSYDVLDLIRTINILKKIAFYVGLAFAIFTIILISSFMFSSISYRKREIGILRGLGARSSDVTKIFIWEGIVLATISFILTSISLVLATNVLNGTIMKGTNIILTPFIITLRQFTVIFVLVYVIVSICSIIPIIKISKMKPIDAILNK